MLLLFIETIYCTIDNEQKRRKELVKAWKQILRYNSNIHKLQVEETKIKCLLHLEKYVRHKIHYDVCKDCGDKRLHANFRKARSLLVNSYKSYRELHQKLNCIQAYISKNRCKLHEALLTLEYEELLYSYSNYAFG